MQLQTDPVSPETAAAIAALEPWMNVFRLGDGWLLGWYKHPDLTRTSVAPDDPDHPKYQQLFENYMAGDPFWHMNQLLDVVGSHASVLELGCGTGRLAFHLALRGASVTGVDISNRNIESATLLQRLDRRLERVQLQHVPISADDPTFMAGESFDAVVVSVFPFLENVTVQLENLARLTRRAALLHVICQPPGSEGWQLLHSTPEWRESTYDVRQRKILLGEEGDWGWRPSVSGLVEALRLVGFARVVEITHPQLRRIRRIQARMAARPRVLPPLTLAAANRIRSRRIRQDAVVVAQRGQSPAYHTLLAQKD